MRFFFFTNTLRQLFYCCCAGFLILGLPVLLITDDVPAAQVQARLAGLAFGLGAALSFALYGLGCLLSHAIFDSPDARLAPLTPLTARRFFLHGFKCQFGFILGLWGLYPALALALSIVVSRAMKLPLHPLAHLNLALTCLLLALFPMHLRMSDRPWAWHFFFFARRLFTPLLALFPARRPNRGPAPGLRVVVIFLLLTLRFWGPALAPYLERLGSLLAGWGAPGLVLLYCFLPLAGLPYLGAADAPPQFTPMLTAVLCALLLCCFRSLYGMFNLPVHELERSRLEWWLENRDTIEEIEEVVLARREAFLASRPWAGNAAREGFSGASSPAALEEAAAPGRAPAAPEAELLLEDAPPAWEEPAESWTEPPEAVTETSEALTAPPSESVPFPADAGLDYQPGLPPAAQVRRHTRYWSPRPENLLNNPWLYGAALVLAVAARVAGVVPHWAHPHPALLAVLVGAIPVTHVVQVSSGLREFTLWAPVIPLCWPRLIVAQALPVRRARLAADLALMLALVLVIDGGPLLLILFPVLFIMNRLLFGLIYWFDARSHVGGSGLFWKILAVPCLMLWLISACCLAAMFQDQSQAAEVIVETLVSILAVTAVLLMLGIVFALLLRFKSDTQVVAPPDFKLVK